MNLLEEVSLPAPLAVPDCGGVGALSDQEVGPAPGDRVNILQKIGKGLFKHQITGKMRSLAIYFIVGIRFPF